VKKIVGGLRLDGEILVAARAWTSRYVGVDLQQGDVIHSINGHRVNTVAELRLQLQSWSRALSSFCRPNATGSCNILLSSPTSPGDNYGVVVSIGGCRCLVVNSYANAHPGKLPSFHRFFVGIECFPSHEARQHSQAKK
jgi:hypothetical protein